MRRLWGHDGKLFRSTSSWSNGSHWDRSYTHCEYLATWTGIMSIPARTRGALSALEDFIWSLRLASNFIFFGWSKDSLLAEGLHSILLLTSHISTVMTHELRLGVVGWTSEFTVAPVRLIKLEEARNQPVGRSTVSLMKDFLVVRYSSFFPHAFWHQTMTLLNEAKDLRPHWSFQRQKQSFQELAWLVRGGYKDWWVQFLVVMN